MGTSETDPAIKPTATTSSTASATQMSTQLTILASGTNQITTIMVNPGIFTIEYDNDKDPLGFEDENYETQ